MRIGISTTTIDPLITQGRMDGIGVYTQNLINYLQKQNIAVAGYSCASLKKWFDKRNDQYSPYQALIPYAITGSLSAFFNLPNLECHKIEKNINLYHATDFRFLRLKKTPTVATLHDALILRFKHFSSTRLRDYKNWVLKKLIRYSDCIITVSHAMVPDMVDFWKVSPDRIKVVYNGIGDEWFFPVSVQEKYEVLKKYHLPAEYLLFVGTLQPKKNVARIIEAFSSLPKSLQQEHPLVIAGKIGWDCQENRELMIKIKKLMETKTVHWLDYVPTNEVRALYQCARGVVYPSLYEGFGIPVLEAFASRVPLLGSNIAAITEIANDAALLVDPTDTEAIRDGMLQLIQNTELTDRFKELGYQRAQTMTWAHCAENTLKVYKKLL
ncbi:MAG: glycosyltransferase family 1 protein [Gammaproteobacteria bacterium]